MPTVITGLITRMTTILYQVTGIGHSIILIPSTILSMILSLTRHLPAGLVVFMILSMVVFTGQDLTALAGDPGSTFPSA